MCALHSAMALQSSAAIGDAVRTKRFVVKDVGGEGRLDEKVEREIDHDHHRDLETDVQHDAVLSHHAGQCKDAGAHDGVHDV